MILKNYYFYYINAIPKSLCNDIIKEGKLHQPQPGLIGGVTGKDGKQIQNTQEKLEAKRKSNVSFFSFEWIYKELHPFVKLANENAGWNFQWDYSESVQYTEYGPGQHYDWHADSWHQPYKPEHRNPDYRGKIRKLSMTLSLTEPEEYEGGNLEFDLRNDKDYDFEKGSSKVLCTEIRPKGSIVIFPSFIWHRVTPVTKGMRQSLVMWTLGYPFK